jgi:hypothetical protein
LEYGGTWGKFYDDCFEFVEIWPYDGDEKYTLFHTALSLDDIALTRNIMGYAMQHCGMEFDENHDPADLAYALFCYSRQDDVETGNNAYKMLRSWGIYRP